MSCGKRFFKLRTWLSALFTIQRLDKPAFVQLGDEAWVSEFFGLVAPDVRPCRRDVFEADFHAGKIGIGRRDKCFGINFIGLVDQLVIVHTQGFFNHLAAEVAIFLNSAIPSRCALT